jgi:polar amino acid transport system substrate-binding protein
VCALTPAMVAQTRHLRLVSTPWSPFTNESGRPHFATDLVDDALRRVGITTETVIVAPGELTAALLASRFDGSAALWKDAERERVLLFSQPYLENRLVLVGRKGSDVTASTLADLAGRKIALIEGYSYGESVEAATGPVFVRSTGEEQNLEMLLSGAVDYMLMDELVIQYILDNYPDEAQSRLAIGRSALVTRSLHFAVRRSLPDALAIVTGFNEQLSAMIADRSYHRLLHLEWINVDIDGDGVPELVPQSDQTGPAPPQRSYDLFRMPGVRPDQHFFLGGNVYLDWASVPDHYKLTGDSRPDPRASTVPIFQFRWGGLEP